ncbi:MAG: prepilin-type N-terminal cleavage/methylation domain-containing protein [Nitrospirae bacterium]|nr:prepilin-type N-terminal cleavage/methylation domain-containing protein [Nitrospirota bacterium]
MTTATPASDMAGFTLIEVIIALTIFSIGIMGISGMILIGEKGVATGSKSLSAVQISRAQMEQLKGGSSFETASGGCTALDAPGIQCQWTIKKDTPATGLSEVEVRTSWNEGEKKRELVLNTLRFIK